MITVKVGGATFGISFSHPHLNLGKKQPERATICCLFELAGVDAAGKNNWNPLGSSVTLCSAKDRFNRATGRKHALMRMLCQHDFGSGTRPEKRCFKCYTPIKEASFVKLPKEVMRAVWETYFSYINEAPTNEKLNTRG